LAMMLLLFAVRFSGTARVATSTKRVPVDNGGCGATLAVTPG
jgi:hypothetical protein